MEPIIILTALAATAVFPVILIALIVRRGRTQARKAEGEIEQARSTGREASARIVQMRRAVVQRSRDFTLFKLLLEVFPFDRSAPFSVSVVWEIEPNARLREGELVPVRVDRKNLRRVFPARPGAHYSHRYQFAYLGIEDDFQPGQTIAAEAPLAPAAPAPQTIYRKRSKTIVCGLPLWEFAFNLVNKSGRVRYIKQAKARAIFAVGDNATGLVAVGGFAKGLVSVGQFSLGIVSTGALSLGVVSIGLCAVGAGALGLLSGGLLSAGGITIGFASVGLLAIAPYAFGKDFQSPDLLALYETLKSLTGVTDQALEVAVGYASITYFAISFALFILSFIAQALVVKILEPNDNRLESPRASDETGQKA